jgi:hypothetical protein
MTMALVPAIPAGPPPALPQGAQGQLPVTPLPAFTKPEPAHGDVCKFLMALYGQDADRFKSMVTTDMGNMQALLAPPDGLMLVANALGVEQGPFAFLAIPPSMFPGNPTVEVIHCIRQYMLPVSTPNASTDPLQHRTLLFIGDMANGQLPQMWLEPTTGLPAHFQEAAIAIPTAAAVQAFYTNHPSDELMPSRAATTNQAVRYLAYIPQAWVPAFIGGLSPKVAFDRVEELVNLMPATDHAQFAYVKDFLRAGCQKLGGASAGRDASKMMLPLANPGRAPALTSWALRQLSAFYPAIGRGPNPAVTNAPPPMDYGAFGDSLARGLSAGMTASLNTAAHGFATMMPLPSARTKEDWTPLQKRIIIKLMGRAEDADFGAVAPPIWAEFTAEGRTAEDIQRVLQEKFLLDPNDPDADDVTPAISRQSAKDIKACRFVPPMLTVETSIQGLMPLALSPRSELERYADTLEEEDADRTNLIDDEALHRRRAKANRRAKAPKDYHGLADVLKATALVWSLLFSADCPFVLQLNQLRAALRLNKEALKDVLGPRHIAAVMWKISMLTVAYVSAPYGFDGSPPSPNLHLLIAEVRTGTFNPAVHMPRSFIADTDQPSQPSGGTPAMGGQGGGESTFGEGTSGEVARRYSSVAPEVKALLKDLKNKDEHATVFTLLRGTDVKASDISLAPGHCLDYTGFGICRRKACSYKHDPTVRAEPARVAAFVKAMTPLVESYIQRRPAKKKKY